jgi:Lipase (class 3)
VAFRGVDERASKDISRAVEAGSDNSVAFTQLCAGCNGNPVLLTDYMFNNATIINEVNRLVNTPAYNNYTIVTAGHSWGGALASIAVIALRAAFPNKIVDVVCLLLTPTVYSVMSLAWRYWRLTFCSHRLHTVQTRLETRLLLILSLVNNRLRGGISESGTLEIPLQIHFEVPVMMSIVSSTRGILSQQGMHHSPVHHQT